MSDEPRAYYEIIQANGTRRIQFQDVIDMIRSGLGPVELADKLGVSRPTERKIRKLAMDWAGVALTVNVKRPGRPPANGGERGTNPIPAGDYQKARAAAKMLAHGESESAVRKKLGIGYRRGKRIIEMATQPGVVAMVSSPEAIETSIQASLDVMREIVQANQNIKDLSEWLTGKINELDDDTSHDADYIPIGKGGEDEDAREIVSVKPYHERQKNIIQAVDVLRKMQQVHLQAVQTQQKVLEDLFDIKRLNESMGDIHLGIRDGLAVLAAGGKLLISVDVAIQEITLAIRRRFSVRKGIAG